jgi:hypothetical protein
MGWYRARGWRGGRAQKKTHTDPPLTHSSWVNIKAGWYEPPETCNRTDPVRHVGYDRSVWPRRDLSPCFRDGPL